MNGLTPGASCSGRLQVFDVTLKPAEMADLIDQARQAVVGSCYGGSLSNTMDLGFPGCNTILDVLLDNPGIQLLPPRLFDAEGGADTSFLAGESLSASLTSLFEMPTRHNTNPWQVLYQLFLNICRYSCKSGFYLSRNIERSFFISIIDKPDTQAGGCITPAHPMDSAVEGIRFWMDSAGVRQDPFVAVPTLKSRSS